MRLALLLLALPGLAWAQDAPTTLHLMGPGGGGKAIQLVPDEAVPKAEAPEVEEEETEAPEEAEAAKATPEAAVKEGKAAVVEAKAAEAKAATEKAEPRAKSDPEPSAEPSVETALPAKLKNARIRATAISPSEVSTSKGQRP